LSISLLAKNNSFNVSHLSTNVAIYLAPTLVMPLSLKLKYCNC
jgi:hypothetical protein